MLNKILLTAAGVISLGVTIAHNPIESGKQTDTNIQKVVSQPTKTSTKKVSNNVKQVKSIKSLEDRAQSEGDAIKAADDAAKAQQQAEADATAKANEAQATAATTAQVQSATPVAQTATVSSDPKVSATKSNPSSTTSTTQASGDINYLIQRESGGNTNASNGQFYGIGQLSSQAYAKYAAGQDTSNYNVQLQAMQGYIADRYGSVQNAISHWNANGWY